VCSINGLRFAEPMAETLRQRRPIYAAPHCTMLGIGSRATKMISRADRSAISRAVAKAIACHNAGKQEQADRWVAELVRLLGAKGILSREAIDLQPDCWSSFSLHDRRTNRSQPPKFTASQSSNGASRRRSQRAHRRTHGSDCRPRSVAQAVPQTTQQRPAPGRCKPTSAD
jgi:hypothetical protein